MWIALGFFAALAIGGLAAWLFARRGDAPMGPTPWNPVDFARQHLIVMGSLAGFSITCIVILIALARTPLPQNSDMDTVIIIFFSSFVFFISTAFLMTYLPPAEAEGGVLIRLHQSLASTLEYRTIFLSWFGLELLFASHSLEIAAWTFGWLLPASLVVATPVIAMITDGMGLLRFRETYVCLVIGAVLAVLTGLAVMSMPATPLAMLTVVIGAFAVNGTAFLIVGMTPLGNRYPKYGRLLARHARSIVALDMQATAVTQIYIAAAVAGAF